MVRKRRNLSDIELSGSKKTHWTSCEEKISEKKRNKMQLMKIKCILFLFFAFSVC